jgi:hypothetical protein
MPLQSLDVGGACGVATRGNSQQTLLQDLLKVVKTCKRRTTSMRSIRQKVDEMGDGVGGENQNNSSKSEGEVLQVKTRLPKLRS